MNHARFYIDITADLQEGVPLWPRSSGIQVSWTRRIDRGDSANISRLETDVHVGTHVEGPIHSFAKGTPVDQLPLEALIGPATVVHVPEAVAIGAMELEGLQIKEGLTRLLFRTRNSDLNYYGEGKFREDFVGLTPDGAQWCVDRGIKLVGIDYLSIARYGEGPKVHEILLKNQVTIVEGLSLKGVTQGTYEFICLPLKLTGREAAPARAVLIKNS